MRLEQLQYLVDVADTHSITRTAQNFFISQQACSNSLKQLENEMNAIFLKRLPSGVVLTEQGKEMVAFAQRMLDELAQTKIRLARLRESTTPTVPHNIRLCSNSVINTLLMPKILELFKRQGKSTTISIIELGFDKMFEALLADEYDLALAAVDRSCFFSQLAYCQTQSLAYTVLLYDESVVCMHRQSPYAQQTAFENETLLRCIPHTIYSISPPDEYKSQNFFGAIFCSDDVVFHKDLLLQKQIVTWMSKIAYRHLFKDRRFVTRPIYNQTTHEPTIIVHALIYKTPLLPVHAELVTLIEENAHLL